ncbi:HTH_Tnp_Tc3_2 domain-containing protein [Trichonephila clavipes]|nr:HTH_Tnp_Tc3_2 domain-containing protein [Trichonephila clavipes]
MAEFGFGVYHLLESIVPTVKFGRGRIIVWGGFLWYGLGPLAVSTGFCRPRATWSVTDWRRVIFSDESRFSLSADDHRTRVWRRTGQRSDPAFIVERHTAISQGVTVWGAISWDTRSSLVVLQGTLTARRYVDDTLTPIVLPMLSSRPGAIYQQDNARPHTARLSQQCLQGYDVLPWPARSQIFRQ